MIDKVQALIKQYLGSKGDDISEEQEKRLAIYGILFEAARSDYQVKDEELDKIREVMERHFSMSDEEYAILAKQAHDIHLDSADMYQICRDIKKHMSRDERLKLMDEVWEIAFADGDLDPHETSIIRRLSDQLGLEHNEFINGKLNAAKTFHKKN